MTSLSLVVLTRNEATFVKKNVQIIYSYLKDNFADFELIISDYSEDDTPQIVLNMAQELPGLTYVRAPRRGIGAGLKAGIAKATKDVIMFYPIDLSWNLQTIERSVNELQHNGDVIIGSRRCAGASANRPLTREIFSQVYSMLANILFDLGVKDTQGTFTMWRHDLETFYQRLESDDPFLQTEILIHSKLKRLRIMEIPCSVVEHRGHSNVSPLREGTAMLKKMLRFWYTFNFKKRP